MTINLNHTSTGKLDSGCIIRFSLVLLRRPAPRTDRMEHRAAGLKEMARR